MPIKSLLNGDFRMLGAIRSASDPNAWYRILIDTHRPRHDPLPGEDPAHVPFRLSCDCIGWVRDARGTHPRRSCKHTDPFEQLLRREAQPAQPSPFAGRIGSAADLAAANPLVADLGGRWILRERLRPISGTRRGQPVQEEYHWTTLALQNDAGELISGTVALPVRGMPDAAAQKQQTAAWAGWMIAAAIAHQHHLNVGLPPAHFVAPHTTRMRRIPPGIGNLTAAAGQADLGDGLTPVQRAELLLQMFLGDHYSMLQRQGYLDVSSMRPNDALQTIRRLIGGVGGLFRPTAWRLPDRCSELVYRVRIDPQRHHDRRVRVFVDRRYLLDLCIVRHGYTGSGVPPADAFLSIFLGLMSDEFHILQVVGAGNIFGPRSDVGDWGARDHDAGPVPEYRPRIVAGGFAA
ncbi:MAG TPA: hypothetical protein PKA05_18675 [Roseiflexaceae bacterium]|nr:hypothetical protein [Roseiflexaceae bacterium]